jgi:serine/threonine protein kinase
MSTKKKYKKYKINKINKINKNRSGGKVIASGGFGCVFKPALACKNGTRKVNGVSKLMTVKHAEDEYAEITLIKNKLNKIPNYANYFLIDEIDKLCVPAELSDADKGNFTEKCSALQKDNFTAQNINTSLNKLRVLSMPNGGITVKDYIYNSKSLNQIKELNNKLIELLQNGIVPMNEIGIYHGDIKDTNILVDTTMQPRLIDWGLTTEYPVKHKQRFSWPIQWNNKSIQFNLPFSVILFSDEFIEQYNDYVREYGMPNDAESLNMENLDSFIVDYLYFWMEEGRGIGHIVTINAIVEILYNLDKSTHATDKIKKGTTDEYVVVYVKTIEIITIYIRKILIKYTRKKNAELAVDTYLNDAFIKNIDKWGFVSTYLPFLKMASKDNLDKYKNEKVFNIIKDLFLFLYETSDRAITGKEIANKLRDINQLMGGKGTKRTKKTKKTNKPNSNKNTCKIRIHASKHKKTRKK